MQRPDKIGSDPLINASVGRARSLRRRAIAICFEEIAIGKIQVAIATEQIAISPEEIAIGMIPFAIGTKQFANSPPDFAISPPPIAISPPRNVKREARAGAMRRSATVNGRRPWASHPCPARCRFMRQNQTACYPGGHQQRQFRVIPSNAILPESS